MATNLNCDRLERAVLGRKVSIGSLYNVKNDSLIYNDQGEEMFIVSLFKDPEIMKQYISTSYEMYFDEKDFTLEEIFSKRLQLLHINDDQRLGLQLDLHESLPPEYDSLIKWSRNTNRILRGTLVHTSYSTSQELDSPNCLNRNNIKMCSRGGFASSATHVVYGITWGKSVIFSFDCPIPYESETTRIKNELYNVIIDICTMKKQNYSSEKLFEKYGHLKIETKVHGFINGSFDNWKTFVEEFQEILNHFSKISDRPLSMSLYPLSKIACLDADKMELFHSIRPDELSLLEEHFHKINQARCEFTDFCQDLEINAESIVRPNTTQMSEIKKFKRDIETKVNKQKAELRLVLQNHRKQNMKGFGMYKQVLLDMGKMFSNVSVKEFLEKFEDYVNSHKYLAELKFRKCGIVSNDSELKYIVKNVKNEIYVFNYYPTVKNLFSSSEWKDNYKFFLKIIDVVNLDPNSNTRMFVMEHEFSLLEEFGRKVSLGIISKKPAFIVHYISGTLVSRDCLKDPDEHYLLDMSEFNSKLSSMNRSGASFQEKMQLIQTYRESFEAEESQTNRESFEAEESQTNRESIEAEVNQTNRESIEAQASQTNRESFEAEASQANRESFEEEASQTNRESFEEEASQTNRESFEEEASQTNRESFEAEASQTNRESIEKEASQTNQLCNLKDCVVNTKFNYTKTKTDLDEGFKDLELLDSSNQGGSSTNLDDVNLYAECLEENFQNNALRIDKDNDNLGSVEMPKQDSSKSCNGKESAQKTISEDSESESLANIAFIERNSNEETDSANTKESKDKKSSKNKRKKPQKFKQQMKDKEVVESTMVKSDSTYAPNIKSQVSEEVKYLAQFSVERPEDEIIEQLPIEESEITCLVKCNQEFHFNEDYTDEFLLRFPLLTMVCPSHLYEQCKYSGVQNWLCYACQSEMRYGLDKYIYCVRCGKAPAISFSFKCSHVTHGEEFFTFPKEDDLLVTLEKLGNREELNILILGETGVGKTTFINAFANYLTYDTLGEAESSELIGLIPSSFTLSDENYEVITVKFGETDVNESEEEGASKTQTCKCYSFPCGDKMVKLIDTPGIGDTKGIDQDAKNFVNILSFISNFSNIHGILLLMKPNNSRLNIFFRFCIQELLKHLHKSASENINFVFTNSKSTFYRPGDTFRPLKKLLGELKDISIPLNQETIYCMDNDSFRYLVACHNDVNFNDADLKEYTNSWVKSAKECERLLNRIAQLKPHSVKETLSINGARRLIVSLARPLGDIIVLLHENLFYINNQIKSLNAGKNKLEQVQKFLFVPVVDTEVEYLTQPRTVCGSPSCVVVSCDGVRNHSVCHDPCHLTRTTPNIVENEELRNCAAFKDGICERCGCSWKVHMHIYYEMRKKYTRKMDSSAHNDLSTRQEKAEEVKAELEARRRSLLKELDYVIKASATFTYFIVKNSITENCDFIMNYLVSLIEREKSKRMTLKDDTGFEKELERVINDYTKQLDKMTRDQTDVTAQEIDVHVNMLYELPMFGAIFKDIASRHEEALAREVALYSERVYVPKNDGQTKRFQFTS